MQIVYGDILFLINFSMDFLSLYITGKALRHRVNILALIASASIGSIYAVAVLFFTGNKIISSVLRLLVAVLMCYIGYGGRAKALAKTVCIFYSANLLLGGTVTAVYCAVLREAPKVYIGGQIRAVETGIPTYMFFLISLGVGIFSVICARIFAQRRAREPVSVTVYGEGGYVKFESLCDTGNLLCDPYNGLPVIVTGYMTVMPILPFDVHELFRSGDFTRLDKVSREISHRVHLFPVKSATGEGLMIAYRPDKITVNGMEKSACIGIIPTREEANYGGFPAVTPQILC